jgi:hypothetical protein
MRKGFAARLVALAVAAATIALPAKLSAQGAQPFYRGKQIIMLIASGAGGGYDAYARTLARYLGRHIPGNPVIVPKNTPGAGGLIAANTLYNSSAPDGLTIAALTNGAAMDPLFGERAARFDGQKFAWIGSIGKLENICVTWKARSPITRIEQAKTREVTVSATGATGNSAIMPKIANQLLGTKFKVIGGYAEGAGPDAGAGTRRGRRHLRAVLFDAEGIAARLVSRRQAERHSADRIGEAEGCARMCRARSILVTDPDNRTRVGADPNPAGDGRPFALPRDTPADRVAILRQAFMDTLRIRRFSPRR